MPLAVHQIVSLPKEKEINNIDSCYGIVTRCVKGHDILPNTTT